MRGRAVPPHPGIYQEPSSPPPPGKNLLLPGKNLLGYGAGSKKCHNNFVQDYRYSMFLLLSD